MTIKRYAAQLVLGETIFTLHVDTNKDKLIPMLIAVLEREPTGTIARIVEWDTHAVVFETRKHPV